MARVVRLSSPQRVHRRGALWPGVDVAHLARQLQPCRSGPVLHDRDRHAAQLRRPRRGVPGRVVLPAARLHRVSRAGRARRERLALLLVPSPRRRVHEARRRGAALRLRRRRFSRSPSAPCGSANREILAGGYLGKVLASLLAEYLNKTGSIILILTLLFLSIVLSTQFSFGRLFGVLFQVVRDRVGQRARLDARTERGTRGARSNARRSSRSISIRPETRPLTRPAKGAGGTQRSSGRRHRWMTTMSRLPCRCAPWPPPPSPL